MNTRVIKSFNNSKGSVKMSFNGTTKYYEVEFENNTDIVFNTFTSRHGAEQRFKLHQELDLKED